MRHALHAPDIDPRVLAVVSDVLDTLIHKKGFKLWWDGLEAPVRKDIRRVLINTIAERLYGKDK